MREAIALMIADALNKNKKLPTAPFKLAHPPIDVTRKVKACELIGLCVIWPKSPDKMRECGRINVSSD